MIAKEDIAALVRLAEGLRLHAKWFAEQVTWNDTVMGDEVAPDDGDIELYFRRAGDVRKFSANLTDAADVLTAIAKKGDAQ